MMDTYVDISNLKLHLGKGNYRMYYMSYKSGGMDVSFAIR